MGFDPEMSVYATKTIVIINPFTYFEILRYQYIQFAQCQKQVWVQPLSGAIGVPIHIALVVLFYYVFDWGFEGVMFACGFLFLARFLAIYILI